MSAEHHIIYVPGLHDMQPLHYAATALLPLIWRRRGFYGHIVHPHWEEGTEFAPKLQRIVQAVGDLAARGHKVSLVGQSAGGSAVMNAFMQNPELVTGVINITGRLRSLGQPTLETASAGSPAFAESVRRCDGDAGIINLATAQRSRIMTIRPVVDAVVPAETVAVEGATNHVYDVKGHAKGGALIAAAYTLEWMEFLSQLP